MEALTSYGKIAVLLFIYFLLSFSYSGITSMPSEGDSLAYHIPIAKSVLDASVFSPSREGYALGFYPGSAEVILAGFMFFHLPLNLYNVLGWVLLTYFCYRLARTYNLETPLALVYAVSATSVLSIFRLLNNQTIDIWLAVFFTASWVLLKHPHKSLKYFFLLGLALGFLVGSKFSGPVYGVLLLLLYGRNVLKLSNANRVGIFLLPVMVFGLSWYIRNTFLTGNPLYPQQTLFLPGNERFVLLQWVGWKTLLLIPTGWFRLIIAFFSEYLLWFFTPLLACIVWIMVRGRKSKKDNLYKEVSIISVVNFLLFFFLPSTPDNIITYLRYLLPAFIPGILLVFLIFRDRKQVEPLLTVALMNTLLMVTYTVYQPKLIFIFLIVSVLLIVKYDILMKYLTKL